MIRFDPTALSLPADALVQSIRAETGAPALVAQVTRGGLTASVADGVSDLASGTPAGATQTFEIGSQTKMMTAVMILQLMEEGRIDLDAPASAFLPAETVAGLANADTATVRQLLNMTSGIPSYTDAMGADGIPLFLRAIQANPETIVGSSDWLAIARDMPPTGTAGDGFYYSNTNYLLLGQIIESVTGQDFFQALQDRILNPLGMKDTSPQLASGDPRLSSYLTTETGEVIEVTDALWDTRGESGVVSTTADMTTFLRGLLVDKTLLGEAALAQMTDFQVNASFGGGTSGFGLGLVEIRLDDGTTAIGFTGGTLGTSSSTYLDTATGTIIATAATGPDVDSASAALMLLQATAADPAWTPVTDYGSPITIASVAAAGIEISESDGTLTRVRRKYHSRMSLAMNCS